MKHFPFLWDGPVPLIAELKRPIKQISVEFVIPHNGASLVTIWRPDHTGLRLCSKMYDVAERREVGVLRFENVFSHGPSEIIADARPSFDHDFAVFKLVIHESGTAAESGVILKATSGDEIVFVAAVHPFHLTVMGVAALADIASPEYSVDRYERVPMI